MKTQREMKKRMKASLERLLALPLDEGPLLILTHHNPDPDCLASSAAMRYLLRKKRGIEATAAYSGIIGRAENRAMVRLLDLDFPHIDELDFDDFRYIALIDAQPRTGNTAVPEDRMADIVIDHHPIRDTTRGVAFYEVIEELGATATLLTEYLRIARLKIPRDLATALLYAIRSETQDLGREVSEHDLIAYEYLVPRVDRALLAAISSPTLERHYFSQLADALENLLVGKTTAVSTMGPVKDPDFVPEIADLVVRMEEIRWALAWGTFRDRLYLSIRTNDPEANAGDVMQKILEGIGKGGGHGMRAGGAIDLNGSSSLSSAMADRIIRRFVAQVDEQERLEPFRPPAREQTVT
ncbi:MAG TPA: DHH family phosphoesterase [Thermoanaerobaculia bacterium]|nr:DHH family phosphoesterase [Thermoanaerobaculia bacterium]